MAPADETDTTILTQDAANAWPEGRRTVTAMLTQREQNVPDPSDAFLDTEGIAERYGIGLTKAKEVVGFGRLPASIVPGMVRIPLAALRAWEMAASLAGKPGDPAPSSDLITVVAPPAARPGGRPARKAVAVMARPRPLASHDCGVALYAPTAKVASFRVVWTDPFSGSRPNRRYPTRELADEAFESTVAYVKAARAKVGAAAVTRGGPPTVDDLFAAVERRWVQKGVTTRYIEKR